MRETRERRWAVMHGGRTRTEPWTASGLWLRWVGATAIGVVLAFATFVAIFSVIGEPADVLFPVLMIGFGLAIGSFQQRVLQRRLGDARRWALATGVGLGAGMALVVTMGLGEQPGLAAQITRGAVAGAVVGAVIGTLQWLVLRTRVPGARWWVVASIAGWAAGAAAGDTVAYFVEGVDLVVAPVIAASVTGIALVSLLRSRPDDAPETAALSSSSGRA
jgi:hypothetical protein